MSSYSVSRRRVTLGLLSVLLAAVAGLSLAIGAIPTGLWEALARLPAAVGLILSPHAPPQFNAAAAAGGADQLAMVVAEIRLPRLLLGVLTGAGLALCGALMQGLFRNPMADPGLLGVSSGAALGAVAAIVLGGQWLARLDGEWAATVAAWLLPGAAFGGGLACLFVVHRLSVAGGKTDIATMLLAGIAVSAIAGAAIGLLSYIADDAQLRDLIFWSLGSLQITDWRKLTAAMVCVLPMLLILPRFANALNANLLGEREAGHLGIDMERIKRRLIVGVALVVGVIVSLTGVIGFVGLVVPHLLRIVIGPDHRLLLPASALFGAALLVAADIVARSAVAPAEIPIGIITALLGGPFFLYLLVRFHRARTLP
ncbi:MAG: iron chelate uptake ABC transporter family permease subunit [Gammaproteobacteria bacterium]|nr:iron chelate uptake ABC transporter family permease subunit [Gammaproteobacteria bacterium]